jgi:alpha-galactosidase
MKSLCNQIHDMGLKAGIYLTPWISAPLLIGCDLEQLDPYTLGLLSNDEVLALDRDALGKTSGARGGHRAGGCLCQGFGGRFKGTGIFQPWRRRRKNQFQQIGLHRIVWKLPRPRLWRQTDLPDAKDALKLAIQPHGVVLLKMSPVITANPKHN